MKQFFLLPLSLFASLALLTPPAGPAFAQSAPDGTPAAKVKVGAFEFHLTPPWTDKGTTRPMVKAIATWTNPEASGQAPVDAAFYHFGKGQGGSTEANIERWKGQFRGEVEEEIEELDLDGRKVILVCLRGTYLDGPMFGEKTPKPDHALLGAIIESEEGAVFIKATAPQAAADSCRKSFRTLALGPFND